MNSPDEILAALLLQEVFGSALVVEPQRESLLEALAATVTELTLCASDPSRDDHENLEALGCSVSCVEPGSLAESADRATLLVGGIPPGVTAEEFLDLALSKTCDDGFVLIDIETESRSQMLRIRRLLEASLEDVQDAEGWSEGDRLSLTGRRRATGREAVQAFSEEPLPLTVLCYVGEDAQEADVLAVSLLFQQSVFPALVLFIDDAPGEEGILPDDLWGMAAHAPAQPALLRTGGAGRAGALGQALEHVETEFVAVIEPGQVPAPRWGEQLCGALSLVPAAGFAVAEGLCFSADEEGVGAYRPEETGLEATNLTGVFLLDTGLLPPAGAVVYRRPVLSAALADADGDTGDAFEACLALHACEAEEGVVVPLPLLRFGEGRPGAEREALVRLQRRNRLDRLIDAFSGVPEDLRRGIALEVRADALLEAGAPEEALSDYRAALELDAGLPDLRASLLVALRQAGRPEEVEATVSPWLDEEECDLRVILVAAWAYEALGKREAARGLLEAAEETAPDDPRIILNLLSLDGDALARERVRRLADRLSDDLEDGELAAYCF